jgi:double-stranded uracil-DNA glycosylase
MAKPQTKTTLLTGFPPIAALDARVLVLGSMPSVASLAREQYYGHPQNAFWPIMGRLFGAGPGLPYAERKAVLMAAGVAVWDVLEACRREGSLDTAIARDSEQANNFAVFFRKHPRIGTVFFNGTKAETTFRRHVLGELAELNRDFHFERLPSTSPAHAGRSLEEKLTAWQAVKSLIDER